MNAPWRRGDSDKGSECVETHSECPRRPLLSPSLSRARKVREAVFLFKHLIFPKNLDVRSLQTYLDEILISYVNGGNRTHFSTSPL